MERAIPRFLRHFFFTSFYFFFPLFLFILFRLWYYPAVGIPSACLPFFATLEAFTPPRATNLLPSSNSIATTLTFLSQTNSKTHSVACGISPFPYDSFVTVVYLHACIPHIIQSRLHSQSARNPPPCRRLLKSHHETLENVNGDFSWSERKNWKKRASLKWKEVEKVIIALIRSCAFVILTLLRYVIRALAYWSMYVHAFVITIRHVCVSVYTFNWAPHSAWF